MQLRVLGPVQVGVPGSSSVPVGRQRDLLALLAVRRRHVVASATLLDAVWAGRDRSGGAARGSRELDVSAVHTVIARLRRRFGEEVVTREVGGYRLGPGVQIDQEEFTALVARAETACGLGQVTDAIRLLRESVNLWRGEVAYEGIPESIVGDERSRLAEGRYTARLLLTECLLRVGQRDSDMQSHDIAERLVAEQPLREPAAEALMVAAHRLGRRTEALHVFSRLESTLRAELGVSPGAAVVRTYRAILEDHSPSSGMSDAGATQSERSRAGLLTLRSTLADDVEAPSARGVPSPMSPIIGRAADVTALLSDLDRRRLITLTGPSGVGKTRLLVEVARRATGRKVWFACLAGRPAASADEIAERILGGHRGAGSPQAAERLSRELASTDCLLALDEADECLNGLVSLLARILPSLPRTRVLVSSVQALGLPGERVLSVAPLSLQPTREHPESPAVHLLKERLTDRDVTVSSDARELLFDLARQVDGLPLALELVAAAAQRSSLATLRSDLAATSLDLAADPPTAFVADRRRHRTLRSTVTWSMQRLPVADARALIELSVFGGSFDPNAAAAVLFQKRDDVAKTLHRLARAGLLQVVRTDHRLAFRLLTTIRDLGREHLTAEGRFADLRQRHRDVHADRWRGQPRRDELLADLALTVEEYTEALRSSLEDRDPSTVADLATTLGRFWLWTDLAGPGIRWLSRTLDSGLLTPVQRARLLCQLASLSLHRDPDGVRRSLTEALPILRAAGGDSEVWLSNALVLRALQFVEDGDTARGLEDACSAVEFASRGPTERYPDALSVLALVAAWHGDAPTAVTAVHDAWAALDRHPSVGGGAARRYLVATNTAEALMSLGQVEEAFDLISNLEPPAPAFHQVTRGWILLARNDAEGALRQLRMVLGVYEPVPATLRTVEVYGLMAAAYSRLASPEAAAAVMRRAGRLLHDLGHGLPDWQVRMIRAECERVGVAIADSPMAIHPDVTARSLASMLQ